MGSTFLQLTNKVLKRINEVELTDTTFNSARGIHAVCKDAVVDAINEINQQEWEWPFNALDTTQTLIVGQNEYSWPTYFKAVDWESFEIMKNETLGVRSKNLLEIDRDQWYKFLKPTDDDNSLTGVGVPQYVFKSHGEKFGVSPSPDKPYNLYFRYYITPNDLVNYNDTTSIPTQYDNVIVSGALVHVNLFKENPQGVSIAEATYKKGLSNMYNSLIGYVDRVRDTRSNLATQPFLSKSTYPVG